MDGREKTDYTYYSKFWGFHYSVHHFYLSYCNPMRSVRFYATLVVERKKLTRRWWCSVAEDLSRNQLFCPIWCSLDDVNVSQCIQDSLRFYVYQFSLNFSRDAGTSACTNTSGATIRVSRLPCDFNVFNFFCVDEIIIIQNLPFSFDDVFLDDSL